MKSFDEGSLNKTLIEASVTNVGNASFAHMPTSPVKKEEDEPLTRHEIDRNERIKKFKKEEIRKDSVDLFLKNQKNNMTRND